MKLETKYMQYLTPDDWRVLGTVENCSRNHEVVPTKMICQGSGLKSGIGAANKAINDLAKIKLIARLRNARYDGYKLTYNGFDYLALRNMMKNGTLQLLETTIGVGKESDIYGAVGAEGQPRVLKIHRLGRVSFRSVKTKRDYLRNKQAQSWMYLSRLAAEREWDFMNVLYKAGFSVPIPYDYSKHCVLMERIQGFTMKILREHASYKKLYSQLMCFIVRLAEQGMIHGDFNEYNIMIKEDGTWDPSKEGEVGFVVIDFPQCVSIEHPDAEFYFKRDVECVRRFFRRRFKYVPKGSKEGKTGGYGEGFRYAYPDLDRDVERKGSLDVEVKASGYNKTLSKADKDLQGVVGTQYEDTESGSESDSEDDSASEESDSGSAAESDLELPSDSENEKIVAALSSGGDLKMDKFGNYILEDN